MEKKIKIKGRECPMCGKQSVLEVYPSHLKAWQDGELIQNALPELNANEREMLKTGFCKKCCDKIFGE